ncbi:structural maintenance of chromosomes 4-like protein gluon isoform X2 [Rhodnius prolixus]|uniref:structural maintenance of chromosomes 4-like protein gluon isoform X2 n=1 Tax=Rhodnius prolixus TaxID=13249 RepID=UPI003D189F27
MAERTKSKEREKGTKHTEKPAKSTKQQKDESDDSELEDEGEGGRIIGGVYIPPPPIPVCSVENIGPRLIITHIVNINFKSYAGRQVLGPFHKNFTSIIGPNGSGKSNVIDSMLFVFGYRATKIRSKKLSVLIHNSEQHRNVKSCTVEVHFVQIIDKGSTQYEEVPNSKIVIARSANNDNQSQYQINGKNARFKEVTLLLRSHGIDLVHNRFLILQGEVEQIALMKPKAQTEHDTGMLEYLEDIIGTTRFKVPLQKLELKLEELNLDMQEKYNRIQAAEKETEVLKEPMQDAVHFLIKENEYTVIKNKIHQWYLNDCKNKLKHYTEEKASLDSLLVEVKQKIKVINEELAVKEKLISAKNKELDVIKGKREHLKEIMAKSEKQSTELKLDIVHSNQKRKKAMESKKQLEQKLITLKNIPEKNTKEIEELKKVEEKLTHARSEEEAIVERTLANLQLETQGLQDTLTQLSNKLIGLKNIRDDANAKYQVAKTELEVYVNKEEKEIKKLHKIRTSLEEVNKRLREEERKSTEARTSLPNNQQELNEAEKELAEVKQKDHGLRQEINSLMAKTQEKRNQVQDRRSRGRVLDFIMKKKAEGIVPGVFGRLGDLGGIDAKYDCAVSTACGPLDYIVTDTVRTAKTCVELLKKHGVGRGNFIALDQQQGLISQYNRPIKTPENIPRLFDLIKVNDERVRPAFYFGLRDTLVANDLSQAKRCAYGSVRYRVVTLFGEIIEIAGTMSGGGRDKRTGRMGRSATVMTDGSSDDLVQMEQQLSGLKDQSNQVQQHRVSLEAKICRLKEEIKKSRIVLSSSEVELKELSQQEQQLNQQVNAQEAIATAASADPEVVEEMTQKLNKLKEELDIANKNSGEVEDEVKKVKSKIDAATGGKMKEVRQKLEKTTTKLNKVTAEITKLGVDIKAAARDEVKTTNRIATLTSEIAENEASILKSQEFSNDLIEKIEKMTKELESINNDISDLEKEIREMKITTNDLNKQISSLKATKLNEDQKMEAIEKNIKDNEHGIASRKKQLAALKLNEIPANDFVCDPGTKLITYSPEEIEEFDVAGLRYLHTQLDEQLNELRSNVNLNTIRDFKEKSEILEARINDYDEVTLQRNEVRKGHDEVRKARLNEFMTGFSIICSKLKEMYQMITLGGDAEFDLIDTLDPFAEGVQFSVRPPKKSWKNISNLSGGEKTLSSLALVFALHYYKPSPLYVMDEIDAALDFKNVSIVANYIKVILEED